MNYLISHSILNSAQRFPNQVAFKCGQQELTYPDLSKQMKQLAHLLQELGVEKGDRVGIYLNRSLETAIAIYGILYLGAVYVPLDPKVPIKRTQYLIDDCDIKVLIANPTQRRSLKELIKIKSSLQSIIGINQEWSVNTIPWEDVLTKNENFHPSYSILGKDLAYIMYTSGSTGNPKGIMHTHASGLAYARLTASLYEINESDIIANHAPIFFDISTLGYFTGPLVGATTVILTDAHTILPTSLSQLIEQEKITIWYSVPLALIQMLQHGVLEERNYQSLRHILYAGEACPPRYLRPLMNIFDKARFCNVYGPAEVNQCTYYFLDQVPVGDEPIPIGQVWGDTDFLVIDENEKILSLGDTGELLIRSATMMQGYWKNDQRTKQSLFERKKENDIIDVFYRTGDLVYLDENSILHFLGRKDHQVKIRGYRVELSSVEVALISHPAVSEVAVFTKEKEGEPKKIEAAVIVNESKEEISYKELVVFLKAKLPHYAIPEQIYFVDTFPRTGSGKVKRSALKKQLQID